MPHATARSTVERAFELARSGKYTKLEHIARQLNDEGFHSSKLEGPLLLKQLRKLMEAATVEASPK
jgi:hypothetical protein